MPRDASPKTKEKNLKKWNVKGSRKQLLDQLSRKQLDQLEALHLEHSALGALIREKQVHLMRCCLEALKIWKKFFDHASNSFKCKKNPNAKVVLSSFADGMPMVYTRVEIPFAMQQKE